MHVHSDRIVVGLKSRRPVEQAVKVLVESLSLTDRNLLPILLAISPRARMAVCDWSPNGHVPWHPNDVDRGGINTLPAASPRADAPVLDLGRRSDGHPPPYEGQMATLGLRPRVFAILTFGGWRMAI